ncbi:hypothetical protein MES4922_120159 [Mesorhizobium ventifaucium]|uniref:Uncharacterized protein n=1 Tax=Mesorhizobium ventifaucium TaxID=666020 RepID=A0ABM9DFS7_9HYPH|nr:hypothetical protein MES4922_120159 [Mesorhizobium ventifaucium]
MVLRMILSENLPIVGVMRGHTDQRMTPETDFGFIAQVAPRSG